MCLLNFTENNTTTLPDLLEEAETFLVKNNTLYTPELYIIRFMKQNIESSIADRKVNIVKLIELLKECKKNKFENSLLLSLDVISYFEWKYFEKDPARLLKKAHSE